jgi:hypothetical protein
MAIEENKKLSRVRNLGDVQLKAKVQFYAHLQQLIQTKIGGPEILVSSFDITDPN